MLRAVSFKVGSSQGRVLGTWYYTEVELPIDLFSFGNVP